MPAVPPDVAIESYLMSRYVEDESGCWVWQLKLDRDGYGVATVGGVQWRAHRLSYAQAVGPIREGLLLDHTCENRACVRPSHLEPVDNFENRVRRYVRMGRPRKVATELAHWDMSRHILDRHGSDAALEYLASVASIAVGDEVRGANSRTVWIVEGMSWDAQASVDLVSTTSSRRKRVPLSTVRRVHRSDG